MSASQAPAADAIAFQLAALLEIYDGEVERMVATWLDMDLYRVVSDRIEEVRTLAGILPQVQVPTQVPVQVQAVALLISHAELMHALWRTRQSAGAPPDEVRQLRAQHADCVAVMRKRCLHQLLRKES